MGGCSCGARTPIFCLNFFWRIFKMTEIFAIFRFFYFMISPPNRLFLAYLQKKIFPFKILWTCRFFSYNNFFSVQLTYKHPVAVFQSDRNLCSLFAPSDYALFKSFISFLQCSGSQWRHFDGFKIVLLLSPAQVQASGCCIPNCPNIVLYCIYKYCIVIVFQLSKYSKLSFAETS